MAVTHLAWLGSRWWHHSLIVSSMLILSGRLMVGCLLNLSHFFPSASANHSDSTSWTGETKTPLGLYGKSGSILVTGTKVRLGTSGCSSAAVVAIR
ncbi:hypothetical protein BO78DRAFT_176976 [Aspergillus sclerotiicarbonarius CBS 121057]|uniref:Uncharacterized protein n=1 Tax=Aspergillus sclerotiicarbonarius (strain CBS 121057 / IBT 28362) TaxID=1448318 RepID=A0A319ESW8_ASPSB|nr:hypothetical protein BO78DRAFT_176976 [Aspergillus sclerotiicarbonarius CBS 121057]